MSGARFHVHGPHDHELEHAATGEHEHGSHDAFARGFTVRIALFTAVVATVGAMFSYMAGLTQANAGLYKNNAAIRKTEASNYWSYFQAKSTKQSLAELKRDLAPAGKQADYQGELDRYEREKNEIKSRAEGIELETAEWDAKSDAEIHRHHRWAQATTALQLSIATAAITLLTRRKWLEWLMFGLGGVGLVIGAFAAFHL